MRTITLLGILICLFYPIFCSADIQDSRERLQQIRKRMEQTADSLKDQNAAEKDLLRDLSVVATSIKQFDRRIDTIKNEQKKISQNLSLARQELQKTQRQLRQLQTKVNKRLVALYKEGEVGPLKLFFSADSPMELVQQYQYLALVLEHDRELLDEFRTGLEEQRKNKLQLELLQAEQKQLLKSEKKSREDATQGRKLYSQILERVRRDKAQLTQELEELEARAHRLEKLISQLEIERKQQSVPKGGNFASFMGKLPWPVNGTVAVSFGTQHSEILGSVLESHGIEIAYKASQKVKAVAHGRIVFASWFKGYGNLMIIAHDNGYHTLYAQTESMGGSVGDMVGRGDVIAQTGPPEGQGLYFEIRHNGAPIDPMLWLRSN